MNETSGVLNETTVTLEMAIVYNDCRLTEVSPSDFFQESITVVQVITVEDLAQAMNLAMQNATFRDVMSSAGLPIDASAVVRADAIPGPSVLQQAAYMGYPSTVYQTPQISFAERAYSSPDRELIGVLCGSIAVSFLLLGARLRLPVHDKGWLVTFLSESSICAQVFSLQAAISIAPGLLSII